MSYAGFWKRFASNLIDVIITGVVAGILGFMLGIYLALDNPYIDEYVAEIYGNILGLLISWIYWAAFESSSMQATPGKMALGIIVTDTNGSRITFGKASGRYFGKIISALILGIGFLMVAFTQKKQGLHDKISDCLVIDK